jgi:hypothetical protein
MFSYNIPAIFLALLIRSVTEISSVNVSAQILKPVALLT